MKTILIVDDIKVNLKVLEVLLTRNGYRVLPALSAEKALVLLQDHSCDLIISDIQMPEMDGFQFCRLCQLDEALRYIPLVFYSSARDEKHIRQQARKVGACAVIRKPADPAKLLKTIDTILAASPPDSENTSSMAVQCQALLVTGNRIRLYSPSGWSSHQVRNGLLPGYWTMSRDRVDPG